MGNAPSDAQEEPVEVDLHVRQDLSSNSTGSRVEQARARANVGSASSLTSDVHGGSADAVAKQEAVAANANGVELLKQQQQMEAVREFRKALSYEPGSVQILNNIGLSYAKMQDFTSAYEWYEKAHKQDVSDIETLFSLAWVERKRSRYAHAKELFQKVLDMDPGHVKALYLLGDILKIGHDYAGAAKYFERLVRLDSNSVDGHTSLAQCYEETRQYSRAAQVYDVALSKAPGRSDVIFLLGRVYYLAKQYREAISYLERVPDTDTRHALDARIYSAKVFRALDDHERAIACAEQAVELRAHPKVMHFLGEEYLRVGDERLAAHWFNRAIDLEPSHAGSLLELGQLMYRQSRLQEAEAHLSQVIEQDRNNATALCFMALVRYVQNKHDSCRRYCEATLRLDQLNADVLWIVAEMHKIEAPTDEKWFLHMRNMEAPAADICQAIAKGYLTRNELKECANWLQKAQHYLPSDSPVQDALRVLARQGSAVDSRQIIDILDQKTSTVRGAQGDSPDSSAKRDRQPKRRIGAEEQPPHSHGDYVDSRAIPRTVEVSRLADDTSEELERLLRRAELASARKGSGLSDSRASEQPWQEVLTSAKSILRKQPEDPLALRCAARSLLSTGGDSAQIRDYSLRAVANGNEATGFTLGYALHAYLGTCHEREQDTAGAEQHYAAALSSKPGDETAMLGLARALLQRTETARARQLYEQVSMSNSSCAESQLKLAEISLESGDHSEAYRCAFTASKLAPMDSAVLFCLGQACLKTARHEEAARSLEQCLALQPTNGVAMQMLATAQRNMGRDQDAISWLKRLDKIRPGDFDCNLSLAELYAAKQAAGASQALHYFRSALQCRPGLTDKRDIYLQMAKLQCSICTWKDARDTLEMAVREIPADADLWQKLLEVYERQQDVPGQHRCFERLVQLGGASNSSKVAYGDFLLSEGLLERAREQFQAVLRVDPANTAALLKMATSWRQDAGGHLDEALKGYEQVLQFSPSNADALEGSAYCHRKKNNLDEALRLYQKCLKEKPTAESPLYYLGDILYRQHRHAECQHYLSRLVETNCAVEYKTGALYILAKSHVSLDDHEEAERYARAGLLENPSHAHFLFILALVKNRMADYDTSVSMLQKGLEVSDAAETQLRVDIHDWLAQAYERKQDYKAALAELDIAQKQDPSHSSSLITRGLVHIQLKQLDQAEEAFRRALAVEKNHALALVRLGYCKLLGNDHQEATQLFQRALQQRCGTVALPRSVKGSARIYMALSYTGQSNTDEALAQLAEARKSHRNFNAVCTKGKEVIIKGECDGLVHQIRGIADLHVNISQAWQLVHLMAKELEFDLREPAKSVPQTPAAPAAMAKSGVNGAAAGAVNGGGTIASAFSTKSGPAALAPPRIGALHGPAPDSFAAATPTTTPKAWTSPDKFPAKAWQQTAAGDSPANEPPATASAASNSDRRRWTQAFDARPQTASQTPSLAEERRQWTTTSPKSPQPLPDRADRRHPGDTNPPESAASTVSDAQRRHWGAPAADSAPQAAPEKQKASGVPPAGQKLSLNREELIDFSLLTTHECLGTGGFGAVYRGYFGDKEVAIKKLFCEDSGNISPLQLEELEKEIAALRGLHHPRLVAFIGACLSPPNLCIVTEYMPNGSLHHLLHKAKTPLTLSTQAKIALQVCEGVAFLHGLIPPVVHRDLKSLNIVLDHSYSAKICDFGLTQSMDRTHISLKDGGNGGSPRYMAPECYDCKGKITEKVDVWAMGCIIIESFGGPLPYDDCTQIPQIVAKVLVEKQGPYIPHHLPRGVRPIIEDCFHFDLTMRTRAQDVFNRLRKLHLA